MRSTRNKPKRQRGLSLNMAPMIDVVFLLLIFFAVVTRFASAERVVLELPAPEDSQARNVQLKDRVVVNCRLAAPDDPGSEVLYSAGPNPPESLERIARRLAIARRSVPDLKVVIRADKRLPFHSVRAVMRVVAENEIEMMNFVAHAGSGR